MKSILVSCAVLIGAFACVSSTVPASQSGDWKFIGDKIVDYGYDRDVIQLGNIRDDFRQIKIRVTDAPLRIFDMKIHYDNGSVQDVTLRKVIPQGGESLVIDLVGNVRHLKKIEFRYKPGARGSKGRARVAVWGKV